MVILDKTDGWLESLVHGGSAPLWLTLLVAVLLGLRHATDPDHLAAVSTLIAKDGTTPKDALRVGGAWGFGHGVTMLLFGLPVVAFTTEFPDWLYRVAEGAVGVLIIYFALRLAGQALSGSFHFHGTRRPPGTSDVVKPETTWWKSFGIGIVHGVGGSYGGALLALATFTTVAGAVFGLTLFTIASIFSMMAVTWLFAKMVSDHKYMHIVAFVMPIFAVVTFIFGVVYLKGAITG